MILLALAIQAATPAPAPESDIVIIGRKARDWRGTFQVSSDGVSRQCKTKRSTGDAEIDAIGCQATTACYMESHPKMAAIMAEKMPRKERNMRLNALMQAEVTPCMDRTYAPLVAALSTKRLAAVGAGK